MPALTGLRGVAAVWVLLFHLFQSYDIPVIEHGYAGVDIFFLLSGFVLSHVYLHDPWLTTVSGYMRFLGMRLARIYPLHAITLSCLLLIVVALPEFATPYPRPEERFGAGAFIANLFLIQNWCGWLWGSWNVPSWSLSAEWFAYLGFPFLLVPIRRIPSKVLLIGLAVAALCGMIGALHVAGYRSTDGLGLAGMVRMAGGFSAGCLVYAAFARGWRLPAAPGLALMWGLLAVGLLLPSCRFAMVFSFTLMVVLAAQGHNGYARMLEWRPVLFVGEISYSVYLVHWIVIQIFNWAGRKGLLPDMPLTIKGAILVIVFVLSVAAYRVIERPARRWGRRLALAPRGDTILLRAPAGG